MNRARVRVVYIGHVQGVGFRYTVKTLACGYEVTGEIRNLPDGSVELVAEGLRDELESFLAAIPESGLGPCIHETRMTWEAARGGLRGFVITR